MDQVTAEDYLRSLKGDELRSVVRGLGLKNQIKNFSKMPRADLLESLIPLCQLVVHKDGRCSLYAKAIPEISVKLTQQKENVDVEGGAVVALRQSRESDRSRQAKKAKKAKEVEDNVVAEPIPEPVPEPVAEPVEEPVAETKKKAKKGSKVKPETLA